LFSKRKITENSTFCYADSFKCSSYKYIVTGRHCAREGDIAMRQLTLLPFDVTIDYIIVNTVLLFYQTGRRNIKRKHRIEWFPVYSVPVKLKWNSCKTCIKKESTFKTNNVMRAVHFSVKAEKATNKYLPFICQVLQRV